jgi:drug/metabolite transporter (DMT)-like permease
MLSARLPHPVPTMSLRLPGASTLLLLTLPPLVWASNAVFGRIAVAGRDDALASPLTLNALRWALALAILFIALRPWSRPLPSMAPGAWRIMAVLGLMSVALYNSMQYLALQTSSAINVTLIAASGPFFMLLVGRLFFGEPGARWAWIGSAVSLAGVLVVMTGGDASRLRQLAFVPGDAWMIAATLCWAGYSWLLRRHRPSLSGWNFILIQIAWGSLLSIPLVAGEWAAGALVLRLEWVTLAVVLWMALGPSLLAYWCWDRGVARAGPILPTFFLNLTPLFAAMMSAAIVGEPPRAFHAAAFALIVAGIVLSQRQR